MGKKADRGGVEGLRAELRNDDQAVIGHGILLTELDERVTRLEAPGA